MMRGPFSLDDLSAVLRPAVSWLLGLREFRSIYRAVSSANCSGRDSLPFERRVLDALDITVKVNASATEPLPNSSPLVIAANHPHGIVDGLALMSTCRPFRPDVRVVTNRVLARIPELHDFCFFVDPFDGPSATARSLHGLRAALLWLRRGGALINVDPTFGDALDALMVVDLTKVDPAILMRYLGRSQAASFLAYHEGRSQMQVA